MSDMTIGEMLEAEITGIVAPADAAILVEARDQARHLLDEVLASALPHPPQSTEPPLDAERIATLLKG